jgi:hypothetical protein
VLTLEKEKMKGKSTKSLKRNYLCPSEVDGSPKGVSVKFVCTFVNVSNSNLQLSEVLGTELTKG